MELDQRRRDLLPKVEDGRAEQNRASEEIAKAKGEGADATELLGRMKVLSAEIKSLEAELGQVEADCNSIAASLPNLPAAEAPDGDTEEDAVVLREVGDRPEFDFEATDHLTLAERHGWIEMKAAAEASGARFSYLVGDLVMVELALTRWVVETVRSEGFEPVVPPVLVREDALYGTGFFPGEREMIYEIPKDELFLVGTSEVSLASLHADQILEESELPLRYAGISTCFRREAGAAGKDTRGIFRVHQFDKVEMFSFCTPDSSQTEQEKVLAIQEGILGQLGIPYRVVDIPVGDLGAPAARKFDCEGWIPSEERYRELTSCSNTTDYQARRLAARFRPAGEGKTQPEPMHTVNGTAVAIGRTLIALIENGQRSDGTVDLPEVLTAAGAPASIPAG